MKMGLLSFKKNEFSQNGEDGILYRIFDLIGTDNRACCEFGAWDGIHLSNTRALLLKGWSGLLIEGNARKYAQLQANYFAHDKVKCVNRMISSADDLESALRENGLVSSLDLLVIDIDGLDYYILEGLTIRPRVICIEVNAGHSPEAAMITRELAETIGQPLLPVSALAANLGYRLVAFNANAFLVRNDIAHSLLPEIDPVTAYLEYVGALDKNERRWMYLVNRGLTHPFFTFHNRYLSRSSLGLTSRDVGIALLRSIVEKLRSYFRPLVRRIRTYLGISP